MLFSVFIVSFLSNKKCWFVWLIWLIVILWIISVNVWLFVILFIEGMILFSIVKIGKIVKVFLKKFVIIVVSNVVNKLIFS